MVWFLRGAPGLEPAHTLLPSAAQLGPGLFMNYIVDIDSLSILTLSIEMAIMIVSYKSFCGYYVRKDEMFAFNQAAFSDFLRSFRRDQS